VHVFSVPVTYDLHVPLDTGVASELLKHTKDSRDVVRARRSQVVPPRLVGTNNQLRFKGAPFNQGALPAGQLLPCLTSVPIWDIYMAVNISARLRSEEKIYDCW
jgi:hypothetical protein